MRFEIPLNRAPYSVFASGGGSDPTEEAGTTGEGDLFRTRLDQIINMRNELVELTGKIGSITRSRRSTPTRAGRDPLRHSAFAAQTQLQLIRRGRVRAPGL
jgi:hypothetical protein